ncbi:MAG: DUF502 domain-containing protein [Nitrospinae bacterium]|nr:DUF502 domain-containing protein [Nitrospinota bacterium]
MKTVAFRIRRVFLTGLLVSMPLVITIFVFKFVFETLDSLLGPGVTAIMRHGGAPIPEGAIIPGVGVLTTLLLVFLIGLATTNYLGRKLWDVAEKIFTAIPFIRPVYVATKQVIETFSAGGGQAFRKVALIEYPRKGMYSLAFITGHVKGEVMEKSGKDLVMVFIPTTPNPTSGFLLMLPPEDVTELDMPVEDGVKMIVSCGLVTPEVYGSIAGKKNPEPGLGPDGSPHGS